MILLDIFTKLVLLFLPSISLEIVFFARKGLVGIISTVNWILKWLHLHIK